jgi:GTP-binding protein
MPITLALVGRTNVGKSTLFNYLTHTKSALTANISGVTRDRRYGSFACEGALCTLIDTGGLDTLEDSFAASIKEQVQYAIEQANYIGLVLDGHSGLVHQDEQIARFLRAFNKPILGIINKVEGRLSEAAAIAEFASLGFDKLYPVSALQGKGFLPLINTLFLSTHKATSAEASTLLRDTTDAPIKIAIIGRPNAGKSTLVNRLVGENRQIVSEEAGTTRDSIEINFQYQNHHYILIDTAGIRRLANVEAGLEMAAVDQSLQSLAMSAVVILLLDATLGLTDQDLRLLQRIVDSGRAVVMLCNKWDTLDTEAKLDFQKNCKRRLRFIPFVQIGFISGLYGTGLPRVIPLVREAYTHATKKLSTSTLTRLLQKALGAYAPPHVNKRAIKLRYAHPGGYNPPIIVIHGTHVRDIPATYKRYLHNFYQTQLKTVGTPLKLEFREKRTAR